MSVKLKKPGTLKEYLLLLDPHRREIAENLCDLIKKSAPRAEVAIKWGQPWWWQDGHICYISAVSDRINFGFYRGAELNDPDGLLEGTGKGMRHIKIGDIRDMKKGKLAAFLKEAVRLNRENSKS